MQRDIDKKFMHLAKGKKVLLVEDDIQTLVLLKKFLGNYFSMIKSAPDGSIAWDMYRKESFDLVITDIEMPNTNGVMLSKGIKARNPEQAILVTSAYTDDKYLVELINIGVDGFLRKPVKMDNLKTIIVKALNVVHTQKENSMLKFVNMTQEITHKKRDYTKSHHQKAIEKMECEKTKESVKEFLENLKQTDPESYEFLEIQKEAILDNLYDMVENYDIFAYKSYQDEDNFEYMLENFQRLYSSLEFFAKIKPVTEQIGRLSDILRVIDLNDIPASIRDNAFDILEFLVNDIKDFVVNMFFEKNVNDIKYFQDSLKENITIFEDSLKEEDLVDTTSTDSDDEIEFF
jgi:YesN/AraC family two-component response regulator